jgi:hypothetical protein
MTVALGLLLGCFAAQRQAKSKPLCGGPSGEPKEMAVVLVSLVGLLLGFLIGVGCRWFELPLPAPRRSVGGPSRLPARPDADRGPAELLQHRHGELRLTIDEIGPRKNESSTTSVAPYNVPMEEFLPYPEERVRSPSTIHHLRRGTARSLRLHRGRLQSGRPPFRLRIYRSIEMAPKGSPTLPLLGKDHARLPPDS